MAETTREMVVRLTMDAGGFKKTASEIDRQIRNIDKEIKGMGGDAGKSKLEEKLGLQQKAVENLQKAVDAARTKLQNADTDAQKLLAAKQLSGLETQLATAEAKAQALKNQLSAVNYIKWGGMITGFGRAMQRMGQKFTMYVGAPLAALGISSFNAFKDYEMALARLKAALPDAGEDIERLNQAALEMSETIPVSYEEIMAIMTSLAKAGVPVGEIDGMTLAMARMSAVTGMTAEEVGTSMVMFMNSMGLPMGNVDQLGAALVRLADESIATEGDIFSMATRMAATSNLAGLSATEVLSLSAAFASMGVDAEAGGSAASKLMKKMQLAAETGKGIEGFADVMGVSTEDFTKMWDSSAADTMLAFFQGLADVDASGETSVLAMLDELGLTEIRLSNLVALGASNPDMFESLMGTGAKGFEDNTALVEKAGIIFETTAGQMDMLANATRNAKADLGENVADTFQPLIDKVGELVKGFGELDEETQTRWVNIGATLIGVGAGATLIGTAAQGVGKIVGWIGKIKAGEAATATKLFSSIGTSGLFTTLGAGAAIFAVIEFANSLDNETSAVIEKLKNIEISIDENSKNQTLAAIAEVKAAADSLSGEDKEKYEGQTAAVVAGYGTSTMFGSALEYQRLMAENEIATASAKYSPMINDYNARIVEAVKAGDTALADQLAASRDATHGEWDASVTKSRDSFAEMTSSMINGMMLAFPEQKARLEQASHDYDLFAALTQAIETSEMGGDVDFGAIMSPQMMERFFGADYIKATYATAVELKSKLADEMASALGETKDSPAFTFWDTILSDPDMASMIDLTKVQGVLDGVVELLDFQQNGETAGESFGTGLTPGLSDSITESIPGVSGAMDSMQTQLVSQAAAMGAAVAAAFNSNLNFRLPNAGGGGVNVNVNSPTAADIYKIRKGLTDASRRAARGYGAG